MAFAEMAAAGIDGTTIAWFECEPGIEQLRAMLLPLIVEAGLRVDERAGAGPG